MKKINHIFTSLIVALCLLLSSCSSTQPSTTPLKTPEDTKGVATMSTPTPTPTPTPLPAFWDQIYTSDGSLNENLIGKYGAIYGADSSNPISVWPFNDNTYFCPRAYLKLGYIIGNEEYVASDDINAAIEAYASEDYPYTFGLYYCEGDVETPSKEELQGPYTLKLFYHYDFNNGNIIYYLSVGDAPEGDFTDAFEVNKTYTLLMYVMKGDEVLTVNASPITWTEHGVRSKELYRRFWETRDRSQGVSSGMHTKTEKDIQDELDLGFLPCG